MLGNGPYYFQQTRRYIASFGNVFKDLTLVKYNADNRAEISRRIVPITYAPKENYLKRLLQQPELPPAVEIKLPGLSFELLSFNYNASRKLQTGLQNVNQPNAGGIVYNQMVGVPYDLGISLYLYIRNLDDGYQILEQLIPFFAPDYTISVNLIPQMNLVQNVPIILDRVNMDDQYEGDATQTERRLVWQFDFTLQANFYGPVNGGGLITETITNFISLPGYNQEQTLTIANTPLGNVSVGETIYQGISLQQANAIGSVVTWNPSGNQLIITVSEGTFVSNANVYGTLSAGSVEVTNVANDTIYATIVNTPNPDTASDIYEDFGFNTYITEFPNTAEYESGEGTGGGGSGGSSGNTGVPSPLYTLLYEAYAQANAAFNQANLAYQAANTNSGGGGSSPGGANTYVQYNNGLGEFAGSAGLTFNIASNITTANAVVISNNLTVATITNYASNTGSTTLNGTVIVVDSFPTSQYTSVKYLIQLVTASGLQTTEVLCMQDGINTYMTEYATIYSANSLGVFSSNLSGSMFNLLYTPYNPGSAIIAYNIARQTLIA